VATIGLVGVGTPTHFEGRCCRTDAYPNGLGKEVWEQIRQTLAQGQSVAAFADHLLRCTDWEEVVTGGICRFCGQSRPAPRWVNGVCFVEDPGIAIRTFRKYIQHRMRSLLTPIPPDVRKIWEGELRKEWRVIRNRRKTGYPDPEAVHHTHNEPDPQQYAITSDNVNWEEIDWAYSIQVETETLWILRHCFPYELSASAFVVARLDLWGTEPDWEAVEVRGWELSHRLGEILHQHPDHPLCRQLPYLPEFIDL